LVIKTLSNIRDKTHNNKFYKKIYRGALPVTFRDNLFRKVSNPYSKLEDDNRIIFIHIPKTAGNGIIQSLYNQKATGHDKIIKYKKFNSEKYDIYYKFGFVRNPWDRFVSAFHYLKQGGISINDIEFAQKYLSNIKDFTDFVYKLEEQSFRRLILKWIHFTPQYEFICDSDSNIAVNYLGKYETIDSDFEYLKKQFGKDSVKLKEHNKSKHNPYWEYYDMEMVEIVREVYKKDIELFNYEFPYEQIKE
jgi:chondroitin 4-sulfotransferase 11